MLYYCYCIQPVYEAMNRSQFFFLLLVFFVSCLKEKREADLIRPDENRFIKNVLEENLREPMELAISNDGNVFWIERYGAVYRYEKTTAKVHLVGKLNVFAGNNDGLLGIALDPQFDTNHNLYLYYSPQGDIPKQHLSRFTIKGNKLDQHSEKIILEIPTQRELCCHSAGSLAFGPNGDLYIAVGDNTNPWEQEGYSPLDERPGRSYFDAQRTSANTNDLRGKILRIHPNTDGSYSIPEGNLFPSDGTKGKAEVYVMGVRNPFRMYVDPFKGTLYFGDIGPDGNVAGPKGPAANDEINVTDKAANFGWPYFVGDNKAYPKIDFASGSIGVTNDPANPVNLSPNNTGEKNLPPAQKAFIWYDGEESKIFPVMGKGGRSIMAGPVYHYDDASSSQEKFPEYYDGTLFIYEWMRNWIKVVHVDDTGNLKKMESFMEGTEFSSPIDMSFGKDGSLYILEYGSGWYSNNKDAKLSKITFNAGNRPPMAHIQANVSAGKAPLHVSFSSSGTIDYDGDKLKYEWYPDSTSSTSISSDSIASYVYKQPGIYKAILKVTDPEGEISRSSAEIIVGNTPPEISISKDGNQMFFWKNEKIKYEVHVEDKEDGSLRLGSIKPENVNVFLDYSLNNDNLSPLLTTHKQMEIHPGKMLMDKSDCKSCHQSNKASVGPSYSEIAAKYNGDAHAPEKLADKIIAGGGGVWNRKFVMIAHPDLTKNAALEIVRYIMTFDKNISKKIPVKGIADFKIDNDNEEGIFILSASYTDKGGENVKPISKRASLFLRSPTIQAENYSAANLLKVMGEIEDGDKRFLSQIVNGSNAVFNDLDLTDVGAIAFNISTISETVSIEVRANDEVLGNINVPKTKDLNTWSVVTVPIKNVTGKRNISVVIRAQITEKNILQIDWLKLEKRKRS
jgi:cytochrome c